MRIERRFRPEHALRSRVGFYQGDMFGRSPGQAQIFERLRVHEVKPKAAAAMPAAVWTENVKNALRWNDMSIGGVCL